ncbi:MAG: MOSC domain-containing protein [SAR324 cluster bacterium]|nr:MOSC domain-containing protein [SAR324 cluster bacterium]
MDHFRLAEINIYPIKSAAGISLKSALAENRGLEHDRRWLLIDQNNRFVTQREFPRMALISTAFSETELEVEAPGMNRISIPAPQQLDSLLVTIWKNECFAVSAGKEAGAWFSEFLEAPVQLVYMQDEVRRPINPDYAKPGDHVSFADAYPYLLIAEASLDDLNSRLEKPLPMNRFRPNLVVSGCRSFEEDQWKRIRIGRIEFRVVKACDRCVVTTIDQISTAKAREPLRTLAQYRKMDGKVFFGQNLIPDQTGMLHLNDPVEVLERK